MGAPKTIQTHTGTTHESNGPAKRPPSGSTPEGTDTSRTRTDRSVGAGPPSGRAPAPLAGMTGYTTTGAPEAPDGVQMRESGRKITRINEP